MIDQTETIRVAIVDSHGSEKIHPVFREALSHVNFSGATPRELAREPLHGHGGWVAWDWASQSTQPLEILLVRVFDRDGVKRISEDFENKVVADFKPHYINYSSGADRGNQAQERYLKRFYNEKWKSEWLQSIGDAICFFAAGNASRYQYSYPQKNLVGMTNVKIIAACQPDGRVARFSSTDKWGKRYVDSAYLGVSCKSLDARTGNVVTWQGTSSACPHAGGDICAKRLNHGDEIDDYWTELGGKGGKYNAEVGLGVCESGRQVNMKETGLGLGTKVMNGTALRQFNLQDQPTYHDFKQLDV